MKSQPIQFLSLSLIAAIFLVSVPVWGGVKRTPARPMGGGRSPVPGVQTTGGINKFTGKDTLNFHCTTSSSFVDMPETSVNFTKGGQATQPVIAMFQGTWSLGSSPTPIIRLVIDGVPQPGPGFVNVYQATPLPGQISTISTNGFNFISAALSPGSHTAKIQWLAAGSSDKQACIGSRSFIVFHN